jgi:O-acetylhomoserine/O-acetylserine sulfhydrylase-like pyridoxal-dependent enzyme
MPDNPVIACTLGAADLADQSAAWRRLREAAETAVEPFPEGIRVRFRADPGVEGELQRLAAVENRCCAWAAWSVNPGAGEVVLEVRSAGDGVPAAQALFGQAGTVLAHQ